MVLLLHILSLFVDQGQSEIGKKLRIFKITKHR
jgi:hypothetical protein